MEMHLQIEPVSIDKKGRKVLSSILSMGKTSSHRFFFVIEAVDYHLSMMDNGAPYLISQLMHAMRFGGQLHVAAALDRELVKNLENFMRRWLLWYPELFRWVQIVPQSWLDDSRCEGKREGAISCFSGGVDSFYSYVKLTDDLGVRLRSLMFMQGFDIDLTMSDFYEETSQLYENLLRSEGVRLRKVLTNAKDSARKFQLNWGKVGHGIYLAAALHLLGHDHELACIPSSHAPDSPIYPWGSNPITDPMFTSSTLSVVHHDYAIARYGKILALTAREECLDAVRVCWRITDHQLNCGFCPKCMATLIALEVAKPDSWRKAFPHVKNLDEVWEALKKSSLNRFQIEQLEVARHHAAFSGHLDLAEKIACAIRDKNENDHSLRTHFRRWFYDQKLRWSFRKA